MLTRRAISKDVNLPLPSKIKPWALAYNGIACYLANGKSVGLGHDNDIADIHLYDKSPKTIFTTFDGSFVSGSIRHTKSIVILLFNGIASIRRCGNIRKTDCQSFFFCKDFQAALVTHTMHPVMFGHCFAPFAFPRLA